MKLRCFFIFLGSCIVLFMTVDCAQNSVLDKNKIEQVLGTKGAWFEDERVFKVIFPRVDVKVTVDDWPLAPFMGLSSWVSFLSLENSLMAMGDLVLFEDEVNPVMKVAIANGLSITALHNHFFFDHPRVYFMHINGKGDAGALALAIKRSFDQIKAIRTKNPKPASNFKGISIPTKSSISKEIVQNILGVDCQEQNGMVKAVIGRTIQMDVIIGKQMGVNSWVAFGGTNEQAIVDGDIAILEEELQAVINALQNSNINIVAIHNHMIYEQPRMLFLHFWGKGSVKELAKGFKSAIEIKSRNGGGQTRTDETRR